MLSEVPNESNDIVLSSLGMEDGIMAHWNPNNTYVMEILYSLMKDLIKRPDKNSTDPNYESFQTERNDL